MIYTVGKRKPENIANEPSGELLKACALLNDALIRLNPKGNTNHIPKGIYYFKTHDEAIQHKIDCLAKGISK